MNPSPKRRVASADLRRRALQTLVSRWTVQVVLVCLVVPFGCVSGGRALVGPEPGSTSTSVHAVPDTLGRPRIGLALSGGAARGLAHVGVLKALHEMRVPIDLVAGTSMGSIVGGLFALGYTPSDLEAAMRNIDWVDLFTDKPHRAQRSYRRKEDDRSDVLDFEFGIERGRLKLPRAFIAGQKLTFAFDAPALHTEGIDGFDQLAIPFRAVATDLRSGEMVVLERGNMVRALRASMSIPGFFSPIEVDDRLLIDGGAVRNLPIDVAQDMGADVIIAVDVSEGLDERTPKELASLLGLSFQLTTLIAKINTERVLPLADVVLRPELGDLSVLDFQRTDEAIRSGEDAVHRAAATLQPYALSPTAYAALMAQRRPLPRVEVVVESITLVNRSRIDDRAIVKRLHVRPGESLDFSSLRRDLVDIYDFGSLERVDFELRRPSTRAPSSNSGPSAEGNAGHPPASPDAMHRDLRLLLYEKTYAPTLLHVGLSIQSELRGRTRVQTLGRLTRVEMNRLGAEWRSDFRLGAENSVRSEWYQPLGFGRRWFTALETRYANSFQDLYRGETRTAEYGVQEARAHMDVGLQVGRVGEFRSGFFGGWAKTRLRAGSGFATDESAEGGWRARFALDRLNDGDFPSHGQAGHATLQLARTALGSETRYDHLEARVTHFDTWADQTFFVGLRGGSSLGTALPPHRAFLLGGFGSFSGLQQQERRGSVLASARLGTYRALVRDLDIVGTDVYVAAWLEAGNVWPDNRTVRFGDVLYSGTLALGADTLVGPVYLSYGRTHRGDDTIFLTVGRQVGLE